MEMKILFILLTQNTTKMEEIEMAMIIADCSIENHNYANADFDNVYYNVSGSIHKIVNYIFDFYNRTTPFHLGSCGTHPIYAEAWPPPSLF